VKKTLYELIGVPPTAPREIIGAACKRRIARLEAEGGEEAKASVYAIREAWHILGDDKTRAAYDASLASPQPEAFVDRQAAAFAAQIAPDTLAKALVKPREVPRDWARIGKYAGGGMMALLFVSIFAVNQNARMAAQKRLEAAQYEAEYGEPPGAKKAAAVAAKPAEPFSAEKAEREMREREAAAREQVEREQQKQEDEFRQKLDQQNNPYSRGDRRSRNR
jgi:curved DNA-binding protein CbpA